MYALPTKALGQFEGDSLGQPEFRADLAESSVSGLGPWVLNRFPANCTCTPIASNQRKAQSILAMSALLLTSLLLVGSCW